MKINIYLVIFYELTKFYCLVAFTSWDIGQLQLFVNQVMTPWISKLKIVSAIFYQIIISRQMIALQKLCFSVFPSFFPFSHCFRGWWKINLKVCDVINYLNKNFITHFAWYLKKEKRYDNETLSIDSVLKKEHFYWKIMQKMCTRGYSLTPF